MDVEYHYPFGWGELEGIANRGDYDLRQHEEHSGEELRYFDEETREHIRPQVIEPAAGLTRSLLAFLLDAYDEVLGILKVAVAGKLELALMCKPLEPLFRPR